MATLRHNVSEKSTRTPPPVKAIADAEYRHNLLLKRSEFADTKSITSAFFGDPLPGYSALDKRS